EHRPGRSADDDAARARGDQRFGIRDRSHAARRLDTRGRGDLDQLAHETGPQTSFAGAVEVDHVDPGGTGQRKLACALDRVTVGGDLRVVALGQAHGALTEQVDRRYDFDRHWHLRCCHVTVLTR